MSLHLEVKNGALLYFQFLIKGAYNMCNSSPYST